MNRRLSVGREYLSGGKLVEFESREKKISFVFLNSDYWLLLLWLTSNFSLRYPYVIQLTGNENTQTYQVEVIIMMQHKILVTNLQGNV